MRADICFGITLWVICASVRMNVAKAKPKSGPYVSRLTRSENCKEPSRPYDERPGCVFYGELYNTSTKQNLLRGNISVLREEKNIMVTMKCYIWEDNKWKLIYIFNNAGCRSQWLGTIVRAFGIRFENCKVLKGFYSFQNVDLNQLEHLWTPTKEYGKILMRSESYYKGKTWMCLESEAEVIPA